MTLLRRFYIIWLREVKRFLRDKTRLVSSFVQPFLWLVIFGAGIGAALGSGVHIPGVTYQELIFPGIIGQTLLFTAMFIGISVIWDRDFGFMKEILVAPVSRMVVFLGKMVGDSVSAVLQGIVVLVFGLALGISISASAFIFALAVMLLITFGLASIGLVVASFIGGLESFGAILTFINMPLFFLSGALFPINSLPSWMRAVSKANPLSYGVDALRHIILGKPWSASFQLQPLAVDLAIVGAFDLAMIAFGTWAFSKMKQ